MNNNLKIVSEENLLDKAVETQNEVEVVSQIDESEYFQSEINNEIHTMDGFLMNCQLTKSHSMNCQVG